MWQPFVFIGVWVVVGLFFSNWAFALGDINHDTFMQSRREGMYTDEGQVFLLLFMGIVLAPIAVLFGLIMMLAKLVMKVIS